MKINKEVATVLAASTILGTVYSLKPKNLIAQSELEVKIADLGKHQEEPETPLKIEEGEKIRIFVISTTGGRFDIYIDGKLDSQRGPDAVFFCGRNDAEMEGTTHEFFLKPGEHQVTVYKNLDKNKSDTAEFQIIPKN
ncbi:MAG TPA: hypothetical protein P5299_02530 [Candidatus Woesebacteria bacterium]|nr:hypothetical protein [Candidatus Woesebacteria bacterium]HRT40203.1 hypothetical protein [Candidatus Woesebacteria bacterium]